MAQNVLKRCIQCNNVIIYNGNDEYKSNTKNNKELLCIDYVQKENKVEDKDFHKAEKNIKCLHVNKNGFLSKHNAVTETSGMTRFLDSAVSDIELNSNTVGTERPAICDTFPFSCYGNLKYLNLSNAKIYNLPENMSCLKNVYSLNLSNNYLTDLPSSLGNLHKLRSLNLSNNKFTELPPCLQTGLQILKYLNISHNVIKSLDSPPLCLPFLHTFILTNVMLIKLPIWFWNRNCHLLSHLNLSGNTCFDNLTHISRIKSFHYMYPSITKNVTSLDISNCGIYLTNIGFLSEFKNISCLNISNSKTVFRNVLMELPMSIFADPSKLVELHVSDVGLSVFPSKINLFTNLKVLYAPHNNLSWLPENFVELHSLEVLNLDSNKLLMLTNGFSKLTQLKELHLSGNQLASIKKDIEELTNLEVLDLYRNILQEIPISKKHLNKLKSFDMEYNKIDTSVIEETGLMTMSDYKKLQQKLRENLTQRRYDGTCTDTSSSSASSAPLEVLSDYEGSEISYRKAESEDEEYYPPDNRDYGVHNSNSCCSALKNEAQEAGWEDEEEEYWDVHDSDEEWDPGSYDQQKAAAEASYVQWSVSVFNAEPSVFPNYMYCPAADHMAKHGVVRRNLSPPTEHQFDD